MTDKKKDFEKEKKREAATDEVVKKEKGKKSSDSEKVKKISETDQLKQQLEETEDKYLRAQAELANTINRFKKEREGLLKYRSQDLAKDALPVMDNLERALAIEVNDENAQQLKKGIEMVYQSLEAALKNADVHKVSTEGLFDPNLHQAVSTVPATDEQKADEIVTVLQEGYTLHDRVLRPAMVIVAQ